MALPRVTALPLTQKQTFTVLQVQVATQDAKTDKVAERYLRSTLPASLRYCTHLPRNRMAPTRPEHRTETEREICTALRITGGMATARSIKLTLKGTKRYCTTSRAPRARIQSDHSYPTAKGTCMESPVSVVQWATGRSSACLETGTSPWFTISHSPMAPDPAVLCSWTPSVIFTAQRSWVARPITERSSRL